jgi:hypothetical protein
MLPTYPAILRDGQLEWGSEGAPVIPPHHPIPVHVTILATESPPAANGAMMAAALAALANAGGSACFGDPVAWQRESRTQAALPGRVE